MLSISIGQGRGFEEEVDGGETGIFNGLESVEIVGGGWDSFPMFALPFLTLFARYGPMEDGVNVGGTDGSDGGDH